MVYSPPRVYVRQEFEPAAASADQPMRPLVAGGHAHLQRFDGTEREDGALGFYDKSADVGYSWPGKPAGSVIDDDYLKVYVRGAMLLYFTDPVDSGSGITTSGSDRLVSDSLNFVTGNGFTVSDKVGDAGVAIGDTAKVTIGGVPFWTTIRDIEATPATATVGSVTSDSASTASASTTDTQTAGTSNNVTLVSSATSYDGYKDGFHQDTYQIEVIQGSTGFDYSTARLKVTTASGLDNVSSVTPDATPGNDTSIGTRGLTIVLDDDVSGDNELIVGQTWTVAVQGPVAAASLTSGGTYVATEDTTYIVDVLEGGDPGSGAASGQPLIQVRTNNGVDSASPFRWDDSGGSVAIGTRGVTLAHASGKITKGDKYYIAVSSTSAGAKRTLRISHSFPAGTSDDTAVALELYKKVSELELPQYQSDGVTENYTYDNNTITIKAAAKTGHTSYKENGDEVDLPLESAEAADLGEVYVHYRAWKSDKVGTAGVVTDLASLDAALDGPLTPDNPVKWGVFRALGGSAGVPVLYATVADPSSTDAWSDAVQTAASRSDAYNLVPLTKNRTYIDLFVNHVNAVSTPEKGQWRTVWAALPSVSEVPVVHNGSTVTNYTLGTTDDDEIAMATVGADAGQTGSPNELLTLTSGNADFIDEGVRSGDIVRINFGVDADGNTNYESFEIDTVLSANQLRLASAPAQPISTAVKFEVWRTLSAQEEATEIGKLGGSFGSRRVRAVFPDTIEAGTSEDGVFLAAHLAGISSGLVPHQALTNFPVSAYTSAERTSRFSDSQLDAIANGGVMLVVQDPDSGTVFVRHGLTTGDIDDVSQREESITRNVDTMSYEFLNRLKPFIGQSNVTEATLRAVRLELLNVIEEFKSAQSTSVIGGQLNDGLISEIRMHSVFKDRIVVRLTLDVPAPLNNIDLTLVV